MATPQPSPNAPYDRLTPDWWLRAVSEWDWQQLEADKWRLSGPCPRCGHEMYRVVAPDVVVFSTGEGLGSRYGLPDVAFVECNCTEKHDGRPDGEIGCGPSGQFPGPMMAGGGGDVAAPEDREWERRRAELVAKALPDIRSAAEKWGATIAALTGVLGVASLIGGRDELAKLTDETRLIVAGALGIAAVLAALATGLAALAAQGTPQVAEGSTSAFRTQYENAIKTAASRLGLSRTLTIGALLALVVAVGFMLFGQGKPSDGAQAVLIVRDDGAPACGTLVRGGEGELELMVNEAPESLDDVMSITLVDSCP
jgi:hypothetical protein